MRRAILLGSKASIRVLALVGCVIVFCGFISFAGHDHAIAANIYAQTWVRNNLHRPESYYSPLTEAGRQFWSAVVEMEIEPGFIQDCNKIRAESKEEDILPAEFLRDLQDYQDVFRKLGEKRKEGSVLLYFRQSRVMWNIVRMVSGVKTVCETGFNTGEGTFLWLTASNSTFVHSFDIGYHLYAKPMSRHIQDLFPGRHTIQWGNSKETLKQFSASNKNITCDVIFIDGGHTYEVAKSDFENLAKLGRTGSVVILDNYPDFRSSVMQRIGWVWEEMRTAHRLQEVFKCTYGRRRSQGFSVGLLLKQN